MVLLRTIIKGQYGYVGQSTLVCFYSTHINSVLTSGVISKVPLSNFFCSLFCCTRIGNSCLLFLNWEYQTPLPISSSSQDIFQTPNWMILTIEKPFGTWLFSYTTSFSSLSPEKWSLTTFPNRLLNTLGSSVVSLTVLGNKRTHSSTSRYLALGDMFVFSWIVFLTCLNISKRIMTQLPTYWYNTDAFWVGECINISCFNTSHPFSF